MKKTGKILSSLAIYTLIANNAVYATTETTAESEGFPSKYIFIGVAALVIVLLLFLGYKMDSKGDELDIPKQPKKVEKKSSKKAKSKVQETEYEADDEISYESDNHIEESDLNDQVEYEADEDEETLFSVNEDENEPATEEPIEEEVGEEFDTSIIDEIDDEDNNISFSKPVEKNTKTSDETIASNSEDIAMGKLENEIDNLDNIDDLEKDSDSFVDELKNFEEPESSFEGFSVAAPKEKAEEKEPKEEVPEIDDFDEIQARNDFLSQMEANLEKDRETRTAKKVATKKSSTTKKTK